MVAGLPPVVTAAAAAVAAHAKPVREAVEELLDPMDEPAVITAADQPTTQPSRSRGWFGGGSTTTPVVPLLTPGPPGLTNLSEDYWCRCCAA